MMEHPIQNIPGKLKFTLQSGLLKENVTVNSSDFSLEKLKQRACKFLDKSFPDHGKTKLEQCLHFFCHDNSDSILHPLVSSCDVSENVIIEVVVSENTSDLETKPHYFKYHTYKLPTFCDFCGGMLFGLMRQGLTCKGCHLNFHERCIDKVSKKCNGHKKRSKPYEVDRVGDCQALLFMAMIVSVIGFMYRQMFSYDYSSSLDSLMTVYWVILLLFVLYLFCIIERAHFMSGLLGETIYAAILSVFYLIPSCIAASRGSQDSAWNAAAFFGFVATTRFAYEAYEKYKYWREESTQCKKIA